MNYIEEVKRLREERVALAEQAGDILKRAREESRQLTDEEKQSWDRMHDDIDRKAEEIERLERQQDLERAMSESRGTVTVPKTTEPGEQKLEKREKPLNADQTFVKWLRGGYGALSVEERSLLQGESRGKISEVEIMSGLEKRDLVVGTDAAGGFTVPTAFLNQLIEAMVEWGGMRQARTTKLTTASGNDLEIPTVNDTGNVGRIVAEAAALTLDTDPTFGQVVLGAFKYSSDVVQVSWELLQDSAFDISAFLARALGTRIGRIQNQHFTTGTGTGQPRGAATAAQTQAAAGNSAITVADVYNLIHAVDPAHRGQAQFMFNDATLRALKGLEDTTNRPLWKAGLASGEPDRIDNFPYIVNQDVADIGSTARSMLFGDMSYYYIRDVQGIRFRRLEELYAANDLVAFVVLVRSDGDLVDPGSNPVFVLEHPV